MTAFVLMAIAIATILGCVRLAHHPGFERPALGVFSGGDLALVAALVVPLPLVHASLPREGSMAFVTIGAAILLYIVARAALGRAPAAAVAVGLVALDYALFYAVGPSSEPYLAANAAIVALMVVGIAVGWVRSGMRPGHLAALAAILIAFDCIATAATPIMAEFATSLGSRPLGPSVLWPGPDGRLAGFGLGDLLLASTYPALAAKAYGGRRAGVATLVAIATMSVLVLGLQVWPALAALLPHQHGYVPLMLVIGPTILVQHAHALWCTAPVRPHAAGRIAPST